MAPQQGGMRQPGIDQNNFQMRMQQPQMQGGGDVLVYLHIDNIYRPKTKNYKS